MVLMKLKTLQSALEGLETFENPKIELEQYTTSPLIAASVLHTAEMVYGDIKGKYVADLGCGSGILCIGAALLEADYCTGFDIDASALSVSVQNATDCDVLDMCDFVLCDIKNIEKCILPKKFDTVVMNPPFGTRDKGADLVFLKAALNMATNAVYSFHKTSTRKYVVTYAKKLGIYAKVIAHLRFDLPASYKFHKQDSVDVEVDLIRFALPKT